MLTLHTLKVIALLALIVAVSCTNQETPQESLVYACPMECEDDKTYSEPGSCPVCKMDLELVESENERVLSDNEISDASIFNLTSKWNTQNGKTIELRELRGEVLIVVMVYTTCKAACPRLVADMKNINSKVNSRSARYIMVSIDPETDTPARLRQFAKENGLIGEQWTLLQGTMDDVREFSNVLSVKYKQISPIDFSHSNIISVFDRNGELVHQQEGLGVDNSELVEKVNGLVQ